MHDRALFVSVTRLIIIIQVSEQVAEIVPGNANIIEMESRSGCHVSLCLLINTLVSISTVFYWGVIETGLALVACCLPTLKPLLSRARNLSSAISLQYVHSGRSRTDTSKSTWYGNSGDVHHISDSSSK
jgi:hypothetical protein